MLSGIKQLEELTIEGAPLTDERIASFKDFSYLKEFTLVERRKNRWYKDTTKAKVSAELPKVSVKFIQ